MAGEGQRDELRTLLSGLERLLTQVVEGGNRMLSIAPASMEDDVRRESTSSFQDPEVEPHLSDLNLPGFSRTELAADGSSAVPLYADQARPVEEYATLEALQFAFHDCMACKLGSTRNRLVFGTGATQPRILFIGEGPGAEEDAQGLPFVGRAGALLTGFITALGLTRSDVYITNVVKCRPPGNRTPEPDEVTSCRPILHRQIELLNPRLIVTLGNVPLKALNPLAGGITKERGRVFLFQNRRVLPTFHPSYLLRNSRDIPLCWIDFRQAFQEAYLNG